MAVKRAQTLDEQQFNKMLDKLVSTVRRPEVEKVVFLLSYKAGLRSQEIAGLEWERHLLGHHGELRKEEFIVPGSKGRNKREKLPVLWVSEDIGKYGSERTIRLHPMLIKPLEDLRALDLEGPHVIPSGKANSSQNLKSRAHALTVRINRYYEKMGLEKCTSHSGRRSFITNAAKMAAFAHAHIGDVQKLAGHKQLTTTQGYLDSTPQQADLIALI